MEVQEEIQNAENIEQLTIIKQRIVDKLNSIKVKIGESFEANNLENVFELLKLMKFYLSLLTQAENKEF